MVDVLAGSSLGEPTPQSTVEVGYVSQSRPAPTSFDDQVWVILPDHDPEVPYGPVSWPAIHGQTMPGQGTKMWLAFDGVSAPVCLTWEGTYA
jgi:hypothetical protein